MPYNSIEMCKRNSMTFKQLHCITSTLQENRMNSTILHVTRLQDLKSSLLKIIVREILRCIYFIVDNRFWKYKLADETSNFVPMCVLQKTF